MNRYILISISLLMSCALWAQDKASIAIRDVKNGNMTTHVIPMIDGVEQSESWSKSRYQTVYPSSWSKNKSVLSDGDSFIHLAVIKLVTRAQRQETANTFSRRETHRQIAVSQDAQYLNSTYFTTSQGYQAMRITMKRRKGNDVAYMDTYFVALKKNLVVTATSACASDDEELLKGAYEKYRQVFDYMIFNISPR